MAIGCRYGDYEGLLKGRDSCIKKYTLWCKNAPNKSYKLFNVSIVILCLDIKCPLMEVVFINKSLDSPTNMCLIRQDGDRLPVRCSGGLAYCDYEGLLNLLYYQELKQLTYFGQVLSHYRSALIQCLYFPYYVIGATKIYTKRRIFF